MIWTQRQLADDVLHRLAVGDAEAQRDAAGGAEALKLDHRQSELADRLLQPIDGHRGGDLQQHLVLDEARLGERRDVEDALAEPRRQIRVGRRRSLPWRSRGGGGGDGDDRVGVERGELRIGDEILDDLRLRLRRIGSGRVACKPAGPENLAKLVAASGDERRIGRHARGRVGHRDERISRAARAAAGRAAGGRIGDGPAGEARSRYDPGCEIDEAGINPAETADDAVGASGGGAGRRGIGDGAEVHAEEAADDVVVAAVR